MSFPKPIYIISIIMLFISIFGLFQIKFSVQELNKDLAEINRQISEEADAIHVLKAEWAYLNQPERLKKLSNKYFDLSPINVSQMREVNNNIPIYIAADFDSSIKIDQPKAQNAKFINPPGHKVKWNYKSKPIIKVNN